MSLNYSAIVNPSQNANSPLEISTPTISSDLKFDFQDLKMRNLKNSQGSLQKISFGIHGCSETSDNKLEITGQSNKLNLIEQIQTGRTEQPEGLRNFIKKTNTGEIIQKLKIKRQIFRANTERLPESPHLMTKVKEEKKSRMDATKTKVVLISNLHKFFNSVEQIYKLCSSFGKIHGLVYMKNMQIVLVEYLAEESVDKCIANINSKLMQDLKFHASISRKYTRINRETDVAKTKSEKFNEYFFAMEDKDRHFPDRQVLCDISLNVLVFYNQVAPRKNKNNQLEDCLNLLEPMTRIKKDVQDDNYNTNSQRAEKPGVEMRESGILEINPRFYWLRVQKFGKIEKVQQKFKLGENLHGFVFQMRDVTSAVHVVSRLNGMFEDNLRWRADFYN